ncbi:macrolide family glycosyltransferase [Oscillibacter sp.]|uniref:macrolide family glycosyltransferase n=1 Tax=Oscillibacter sp. TaxID=1945593 RepID=UPI001B66D233|nr:macrolide family glycosyltransferase [Oscillibacter sp.]MBP3510313.1 glycosyl transferase [Oscillibacter sp.]
MNRIAFFCIPAWGHTNPTVEVVRTLVRQGHQVLYYSFVPFREKLEEAGAEVVLCDSFLPPPPKDLDKKVGKDFSVLVEMAADTTLALEEKVCRELAEFQTEVIVSDSVCFWGKLFAWKLGIPYVCSTTTFAFNLHTARLMKPKAGEMLRTILGGARVERKLTLLRQHGYPVENLTDLIQNDNDTDTIVYTSKAFQPMAETFSERYAFVGPSLPEIPKREEKERPLVYVSMGTVVRGKPGFYRRCVEALSSLDVDVVMSVGTEENVNALGPLPENVQAASRVDQLAVLAQADAFLTHCGMNSASEAIWCGVPTVLYPQQSEEGAVADRMEELGLGLRLKNESHIREAISAVLTEPSYQEKTCAMGETFRDSGGAQRAAEKILSCIR